MECNLTLDGNCWSENWPTASPLVTTRAWQVNTQVSYLATALSAGVQTVTFLARQAVLWLSGLRQLSSQSFSRLQRLVLFVLLRSQPLSFSTDRVLKVSLTWSLKWNWCVWATGGHTLFPSRYYPNNEATSAPVDKKKESQKERLAGDISPDENHCSSSTLLMQWAQRPPITSEAQKESSSMTVIANPTDANSLHPAESDLCPFLSSWPVWAVSLSHLLLFLLRLPPPPPSSSFSSTLPLLLPLGNLKSTLLKARSGNLNVKHSRWKPLMDDPVWVQDLVLSRGCRFEEAYRQWGRGSLL